MCRWERARGPNAVEKEDLICWRNEENTVIVRTGEAVDWIERYLALGLGSPDTFLGLASSDMYCFSKGGGEGAIVDICLLLYLNLDLGW